MANPIFIIGCPRSGTTILGEFFEKSPQCEYYNEFEFWKKNPMNSNVVAIEKKITRFSLHFIRENLKMTIFFKGFRLAVMEFLKKVKLSYDESDREQGHRLTEKDVTEKIREHCHSYLSDKHLVVKGAKNSLRIPFLKTIFPDAVFIHIFRDGRDITCSMMNGPAGIFWSYIKPPGWKKKKKELKGYLRCAWQCKSTMDIINSDKTLIPKENFIELEYEKFVNDPEQIIRDIFKKLNLNFGKAQENICKKIKNKVDESDLPSSDRATVLDHAVRIGRYKTELSKEELNQVEKILGYR